MAAYHELAPQIGVAGACRALAVTTIAAIAAAGTVALAAPSAAATGTGTAVTLARHGLLDCEAGVVPAILG